MVEKETLKEKAFGPEATVYLQWDMKLVKLESISEVIRLSFN